MDSENLAIFRNSTSWLTIPLVPQPSSGSLLLSDSRRKRRQQLSVLLRYLQVGELLCVGLFFFLLCLLSRSCNSLVALRHGDPRLPEASPSPQRLLCSVCSGNQQLCKRSVNCEHELMARGGHERVVGTGCTPPPLLTLLCPRLIRTNALTILSLLLLCCGMSLDGQGEDQEWSHGGEDLHEFAYEEYASAHKKKKQEKEADTGDDAAPPLKDAFLGKHCPICLGEISDSSSVIDSCNHIYCTACLFEVGQQFGQCQHTYCRRLMSMYVCSRTAPAAVADTRPRAHNIAPTQPYPTLANPTPAVQLTLFSQTPQSTQTPTQSNQPNPTRTAAGGLISWRCFFRP